MFLEKVTSIGLAHLSYVIGDAGKAAVIDPRRDIEIYLEIALKHNCQIQYIFETHRNEDYVIGSVALSEITGAEIFHGKALDFRYGNAVVEGNAFDLGDIRLQILHTPGHTYESISLAIYDMAFSREQAVGVFTGDALFIGDVGRTDFFPDRKEEVANLLFDSIFDKILPLGDQAILYPAHGAGSVCGSGMASREFSTLGYERANNPVLQKSRRDFVQQKISETHYQPPHFRKMEEYNLNGVPYRTLPRPKLMSPAEFENAIKDGMVVLDTRSTEAFAGAFIPGSLYIPLKMVAAFAGWYLPYDKPIGVIVEEGEQLSLAIENLFRIGYDQIVGCMSRGMSGWESSGRRFDSVTTIHAQSLIDRIERKEPFTLLDVRGIDEFKAGHLPNARHLYVGHLPQHLDDLPRPETITTFCGTGQRAMIAASLLKAAGFESVENCLGSMKACKAVGCPISK